MITDRAALDRATRGVPFLGVLPRLFRDPAGLAVDLMRATDDVVPLRVGPATIYFAHHPDHLRHIQLDNYRNYHKGPLFARGDIIVGKGLVLNEGDDWLRQRRLMQPPFAAQRLAGIVPSIVETARERTASWRGVNGPREMWREMSEFVMTAQLRTMFGMKVDEASIARFSRAYEVLVRHVALRGMTFFLPDRFPLPGRSQALAALDDLHRLIDPFVTQRRASGHLGDDLLGLMLASQDESGAGMSDTQIRDEIKTAVFGGYGSTATGIAWTMHLLATHPESAERARDEVLRVMPEGDPSFEQVGALDYLGRAFQEALRLCPPFSFHPRMAIADDVIGGRAIPAGATLVYSNHAPGRNPAYWQHPDSFYPDHFLPAEVAKRDRFAYQPFGAGPRICIGLNLAILKAKIILALALRDYDFFRAVNTPKMQAGFGVTLAKGGVWIELRREATRIAESRSHHGGRCTHDLKG